MKTNLCVLAIVTVALVVSMAGYAIKGTVPSDGLSADRVNVSKGLTAPLDDVLNSFTDFNGNGVAEIFDDADGDDVIEIFENSDGDGSADGVTDYKGKGAPEAVAHNNDIPDAVPDGDLGLLSETEGPISLTIISPDGNWSVFLDQNGTFLLTQTHNKTQPEVEIGTDVLPEIAFSADSRKLAFSQRRPGTEADIMVISIPPDGEAHAVVEWSSSEDRPSFSPDGKRLAFVSGRTGIASIYVVDLERPGLEAKQITNVGIEKAERFPGEPPNGFIPPPDQNSMKWIGNQLNWIAEDNVYQVEVQ